MSEPIELKDIAQYAPDNWFEQEEGNSLWLRVYMVFRVPEGSVKEEPTLIRLGEVVAILFHGQIRYHTESGEWTKTGTEWRYIQTIHGEPVTSPEGTYLALITPYEKAGQADEGGMRERLSVAAGLLAAFQGRNIVFEVLFENVVPLSGEWAYFTRPVENPYAFPEVILDPDYLSLIEHASLSLLALDEEQRSRVGLSLRWFEMATHDPNHLDAFLKYWLAIETLAMPDETNITPINERLAGLYGLTREETGELFRIGRIYGKRSRIVHQGELRPIDYRLLLYMEAVYRDLLRLELGIEPSFRVRRFLQDNPAFDLLNHLS